MKKIDLPDMSFLRARGVVKFPEPRQSFFERGSKHPELRGVRSHTAEYRTIYSRLWRRKHK
jgi:hypothetical protein